MGTGATLYLLDGIWNMNTGNMTQTTITPNPDTIQEVRTLQKQYQPQVCAAGRLDRTAADEERHVELPWRPMGVRAQRCV